MPDHAHDVGLMPSLVEGILHRLAVHRQRLVWAAPGLTPRIERLIQHAGFNAYHSAAVHICGRRDGILQQAVAELRAAAQHGGSIESHICDVREADQIEAMIERIWASGPLMGLVNNAAANFISPSVDISPRGFAAVRSTVMDGALFATLACGRRWIAAGPPGSVVSMLVT
jgi:NADP-dependent 3-hydroxy acid dehydrogenase YdfG